MSVLKKYRIVVVEPSVIVVEGLKKILAGDLEFVILECIGDAPNWLERVHALEPDMVWLNPDVLEYHKRMNVRGLFHTMPEIIPVALVYGFADTEMLKQYNGVISIYDDRTKIIRKLRQAIESKEQSADVNDGYDLSDREREILVSVVKGLTNKEVADTLHISVHTVISHRKNISRKTGIKSVPGLTVYALLNGLIAQSDV